jgi:microcystin-dependent protein
VNFALPDLRGRTPIHIGNGHNFGEKGGEQAHTLTIAELPTHTHTLAGTSSAANSNNATNAMLGAVNNSYGAVQNLVALSSATLINTGGGQAHLNMQPFSTVNFSIALQGIFPSRN